MNKLRHSKFSIVLAVFAMLGLLIGPALALGCCCAAPVEHSQHAAQSAMDAMPCCQQEKTTTDCQSVPALSHHCQCPHSEAKLFVNNSTANNAVAPLFYSLLPARVVSLTAPAAAVARYVVYNAPTPPQPVFSSLLGRAPPVC